ncbi:hypothetical protein CPHO_01835 [Corynebacterium phocae]|uniref:Uncharacterized protein n=1 Tax=Corynebacterium phocae TaxID=161895 RepID=A0A1L7D188_9CORY|nr:SpaH/EbpB family LPXTG-anchored major pilin [Corynebacterium phocae]APT91854.1 hypothetical protein CPHO_01835 [Corynebacterium phocae]KAA8727464.1 SpaH/EbpB family LPXTG-anchored major pilin [Corynebacterium phocae]
MMKFKKGFAVAIAAGVLATGSFGSQMVVATPSAVAAEGDFTHQALPVQPQDGYTLKIHKYGKTKGKFAENGDRPEGERRKNNGVAITDIPNSFGDPVAGVVFEAYKIGGIDLSTNSGWQNAEKFSKVFNAGDKSTTDKAKSLVTNFVVAGTTNATLGTATETAATDAQGETSLTGLDMGLYLVVEKSVPSGYKRDVQPFIVALPMTDPDAKNQWLNTVHVYPKNSVQEAGEITKTVEEVYDDNKGGATGQPKGKALLAGSTEKVRYKIEQDLTAGDPYTKLILSDFYPNSRLTVDKTSTKVYIVDTTKNPGDQGYVVKDLEKTNHWTDNDAAATDDAALNAYAITLTDTETNGGLAVLNEQTKDNYANYAVVADVYFTVSANGNDENTPIVNKFKGIVGRDGQTPPDGEDPNKPPAVTPPGPGNPNGPDPKYPRSYYGNVNIKKTNVDEDVELENVEFNLYECTKDATAETYTIGNGATPLNTDPIKTLADQNVPEIKGLLATDYRNGSVNPNANTTAYCLVETKTAPGYELLVEPIGFQLPSDNPNATIALKNLSVKNVQENGNFNLPMTGGMGVIFILLGGAAALLFARLFSVFGRRNEA